ncbi:MAG: N-acetylmuramoyl-L-alanine amidase-like domain-containing protein [Pseudomonadota bacterium]
MPFRSLLLAVCTTLPLLAQATPPSNAPAAAQQASPAKQLFQMTPQEVDRYIAEMQQAEPDLRKRIAAIARRNIGQPYRLNLMGEYPYQLNDGLPMFSLGHSDCVTFAEHSYAMALSRSWAEFFWMLQRIRYKDGVVGVATRNHYTEVDWNINNGWLLTDASAALGGAGGASYRMTVDRAGFLKSRHNTDSGLAVQVSEQAYVPKARVAAVLAGLRDGDMVNVVSRKGAEYLTTHVGLVVVAPDGRRNLLHSSAPQVREESFDAFIARTEQRQAGRDGLQLAGFKFLRLNEQIVVPPAAPQPRP